MYITSGGHAYLRAVEDFVMILNCNPEIWTYHGQTYYVVGLPIFRHQIPQAAGYGYHESPCYGASCMLCRRGNRAYPVFVSIPITLEDVPKVRWMDMRWKYMKVLAPILAQFGKENKSTVGLKLHVCGVSHDARAEIAEMPPNVSFSPHQGDILLTSAEIWDLLDLRTKVKKMTACDNRLIRPDELIFALIDRELYNWPIDRAREVITHYYDRHELIKIPQTMLYNTKKETVHDVQDDGN